MSSWIGFLTGLVVATLVITTFWRPAALSTGPLPSVAADADPSAESVAAPVTTQQDGQSAFATPAKTVRAQIELPDSGIASTATAKPAAVTSTAGPPIASAPATASDLAAAAKTSTPIAPTPALPPPVAAVKAAGSEAGTLAPVDRPASGPAQTTADDGAIPEFRWDSPPGEPTAATAAVAKPQALPAGFARPANVTQPAEAQPATTAPDPMAATPAADAGPAAMAASDPRNWHAFWRPFTSELSAKGFRQRLERVTGLEYRVVRVAAGEYHVAFAYFDDQERLTSLSAIEAATGLTLEEQLP